jgi:hypothetical protein
MKSVNNIDISKLESDAVLLVDTQDEQLKMIVGHNKGPINGRCLFVSSLDKNEIETERGIFMISNIIVGKPINGVLYPKERDDGIVELAGTLKTTEVKAIEVY